MSSLALSAPFKDVIALCDEVEVPSDVSSMPQVYTQVTGTRPKPSSVLSVPKDAQVACAPETRRKWRGGGAVSELVVAFQGQTAATVIRHCSGSSSCYMRAGGRTDRHDESDRRIFAIPGQFAE